MTGEVQVDLDALAQAGKGIIRVLDQLAETDVHDLDGPSARYGHEGVHAAFEHFCERWHYGLEVLTKDGAEIAGGLARALSNYRAADDQAAEAIHRTGNRL